MQQWAGAIDGTYVVVIILRTICTERLFEIDPTTMGCIQVYISEYMCSPVCFKLTAKYKICCLDGEMRLGIGKSSVKHTSFPLSMSICDVQATSKQSSYLRNTKRQHLSIVCARCVCVPDRFEIRADERWDDPITTTIIHFTHLPSQCRQISFGLWMKTLVARLNCYF